MVEKPPFPSRSALRAVSEDILRGRVGPVLKRSGGDGLSKRLDKILARQRAARGLLSGRAKPPVRPFVGDGRQRVVVKVSFHKHGFAGASAGGKLIAHGGYLQRDGAEREGEKGRFYDADHDVAENAPERLREWAQEDRRHFRIMLAPESGARFVGEEGGLKDYTRETMARMERDLGVKLDWLGIDHHNTDNPHTHVIVRGVRRDGGALVLPRAYVSHGLREAAREVATDRLGARGREDERLKLDREVSGRGFNRLDQAIERDLNGKSEILLQRLGREREAAFANAMRARAQELARLGLAREVRRNVMRFETDWRERLEATRALDVRRALARAQLYEKRMGRVAGIVRELGPRGEHPDRALLVIETPDRGRVLFNTSMEKIVDLQAGSLVALTPDGKRGDVERLSFYSPDEQVRVRAQTELDRELDRMARGEARKLPQTKEVMDALEQRARILEAHEFGVRSESGKFYFRSGAMERLERTELEKVGREVESRHGGVFCDVARDGDERARSWRVRESRELFAGKVVELERGREWTLAPLKPGIELGIGDRVTLSQNPGRELEVSKALGKGLGLDR